MYALGAAVGQETVQVLVIVIIVFKCYPSTFNAR